jgi:serine protease
MNRIGVLVLLLVSSTSLFAQQVKTYIVGTRHSSLAAAREIMSDELPHRSGRGGFRAFESIDGFAIELTDAEVAQLRKSPNVRYVEPEVVHHKMTDSITPGQETNPYGVAMVNAPSVWPVTRGAAVNSSTTINVVVIDTGVDYDNAELKRAYKGGWNTYTNTPDPRDDEGHGTHVAGTIAAAQNGTGVTGVAPDVNLWSVKVLDGCGLGGTTQILAGIDWVIAQKKQLGGNWIMSLSLGSRESGTGEREGFQKAYDNGILTFAASGNSYGGSDGLAYPADYPSVISVGAIDSAQKIASFSQRGVDLKVVAPGVDILSTFINVKTVYSISSSPAIDAYPLEALDRFFLPLNCSIVSPRTANIVGAGSGNVADFKANVAGNFALIERGGTSNATGTTLTFAEKARNAKSAGAIGVIVYNNRATDNANEANGWSMTNLVNASDVPALVVGVSQDQGAALLRQVGSRVTIGFSRITNDEIFALESGTSMAAPHASAAAALVWAVAPNASNEQIRTAILNNAHDLGTTGFDTTFGYGLIDAFAAAKALSPGLFGSPTQPPPTQPPTGRRSLRRG